MFKQKHVEQNLTLMAIFFLFGFLAARGAYGSLSTALFILDVDVKTGQPIILPVNVNKVDKLAGVKLVIKYDNNVLVYVESKKTDVSKSFMYVVNDKKPGELIIVMAGAKGITAEKVAILSIQFKSRNNIDKKTTSVIHFVEGELMDENLKKIEFNPFDVKISIIP